MSKGRRLQVTSLNYWQGCRSGLPALPKVSLLVSVSRAQTTLLSREHSSAGRSLAGARRGFGRARLPNSLETFNEAIGVRDSQPWARPMRVPSRGSAVPLVSLVLLRDG